MIRLFRDMEGLGGGFNEAIPLGTTKINKTNNTINVLELYKEKDVWYYDDADLNVYKEAFVLGSSELITSILEKGKTECTIMFSSKPFPEEDLILNNIDEKMFSDLEGWYINAITGETNWLCSELLSYFSEYPLQIYVKIMK